MTILTTPVWPIIPFTPSTGTRREICGGHVYGGVNLFNKSANKFTHYKHNSSPESLGTNNVLDILEDGRDNLWIGTDGGGLDRVDGRTGRFTHFTHSITDKSSICGNYVLALCEDHEGNIWAGTWGDGITVVNREGKVIKKFRNDPTDATTLGGNNVYYIVEDKDRNFWVGTFGGGLSNMTAKRKYSYGISMTTEIPIAPLRQASSSICCRQRVLGFPSSCLYRKNIFFLLS